MWKRKIQRLLKSGLTQVELAGIIDVTQAYISQMANGLKREPSYTIGQKIDAQIALLDAKK